MKETHQTKPPVYNGAQRRLQTARFVVSLDDYQVLLPFSGHRFESDGNSDSLGFPFEFDLESVQRSNQNIRRIKEFIANGVTYSRIRFEEGTIAPIHVVDSQGQEHYFPVCEGTGYDVNCMMHSKCRATLIGHSQSNWVESNNNWCIKSNLPIVSNEWNQGALGFFFSAYEWRRLEELGIIFSFPAVELNFHELNFDLIKFGNHQFQRTGDYADLNIVDAIELTPGGSQLLLCAKPKNEENGYFSMLESVLRYSTGFKSLIQ